MDNCIVTRPLLFTFFNLTFITTKKMIYTEKTTNSKKKKHKTLYEVILKPLGSDLIAVKAYNVLH